RTWVTSLISTLRFDDDDAVGAAHAVHRSPRGVFHYLDGRDVARIDARETPARSGLDFDAVDHVQRLVAAANRGRAADAHREGAVGCARDRHAGEAVHQEFFDRLAGLTIDVLGGHHRATTRRGTIADV